MSTSKRASRKETCTRVLKGLCPSPVSTPGVLFDWALPLLTPGNGKAATGKDVGVRFAALSALRECLAVADDVTLARYATAVCSAVQRLLEDEQTQMQLLPPLLGVVVQVKTCSLFHSPGLASARCLNAVSL